MDPLKSGVSQSFFSYRNLSIIQTIAITLSALSIFDLGYSNQVYRGIWFNWLLFHSDSIPNRFIESGFWGEFQFIGFWMFIVAGCQLLKAIPIENWDLEQIAHKTGILAIIFLAGFPFMAILINLDKFDFQENTLSSLVDFGWQSTILLSWGLMMGSMISFPFLVYLSTFLQPKILARLTLALMIFSVILIFFIGLTLPSNEPWNHGSFASLYWIFVSLTVTLVSFTLNADFQSLRIVGLILGIILLIVLVVKEFIVLPAYVQFLFTALPLLWFILIGRSIFDIQSN